MKKILAGLFLAGSVVSMGASFELGLLSPMQLETPNTSISGVRIGAIWTENRNVEGLDLNLIASKKANFTGLSLGGFYDETTGDFTGVKIPFWGVNRVGGNFTGLQFGSLNMVDKHMLGAQFGLINLIGTGEGLQVSAFNKANSMKGFQVGFVNYTERLQGLQIGLINMAKNSQVFEVLPFVNFNLNF